MNKIVRAIVAFSLKNKLFIIFATIIIAILGAISYSKTPIEAYPDITNTQIIIITQWQGRGAEEVERQITIPIEIALNSVQEKTPSTLLPCLDCRKSQLFLMTVWMITMPVHR